jgi:riboflavin kinase/FMN adenylyltransferase
MQIIEWHQFLKEGLPLNGKPASVTVGVFDGVHRGHQALIKRIVSHEKNAVPVVVTFRQNHKNARNGEGLYLGDIQSFRQRVAAFENLGAELTIVIEFSESFRHMSGAEFFQILRERGKMGFLAVGSDFRCGYRLDTDAPMIKKINEARGVPAEIVESLTEGSTPISSSRIRAAIARGRLGEAAAMLGYPYTVDIGDTAAGGLIYNAASQGIVLPPPGRYQVLLHKKAAAGKAAEIQIEIQEGCIRLPPAFADGLPPWEYVEFLR